MLLVLAALVAGGCHAQEAPPVAATPAATPEVRVSAAEERRLRALESRIGAHCVQIAQALVEPEARPAPAEEAAAFKAADDFVDIVRSKPTALIDEGQDLRLFLGDVIENLEGANCDPRMIVRLEEGLASLSKG